MAETFVRCGRCVVAATLPVPIDSFAFFHTEINIVGVDVLHALFGGCVDPCSGIGYPRIVADVHFLLLGPEYENVLHPHVVVHVEAAGVCRKIVDVGLEQAAAEVGRRTVTEPTECSVERLAEADFLQPFYRYGVVGDVHHAEAVACGVAYFEMPHHLLRAVDAVVYRVSHAGAIFKQSDAEDESDDYPREEVKEDSPSDFPFRLSFEFFVCHDLMG